MTGGPLNVAETEALARAVLATATYAFFAGGAADGRALRANREAFEAVMADGGTKAMQSLQPLPVQTSIVWTQPNPFPKT